MRIWSITLRIAQRVRQKIKQCRQCLQSVIDTIKKWLILQKNNLNVSQKVFYFWQFLKRLFGGLKTTKNSNQKSYKDGQENLPQETTLKENLLKKNPLKENLSQKSLPKIWLQKFQKLCQNLRQISLPLCKKIQPYKQKSIKIFSTLFAPIFLWLKSICVAIFSAILLPIYRHLANLPFIQKISQVLKRHCHRYRRKIFVKSARAIQKLKHIFYKTHFVALSFYALCGILALFSAFGFGVKYGIETLLSPSKPSTFFASFIQSHLKSSLEKSSFALVPKDYLEVIKNQADDKSKQKIQKNPTNPPSKPTPTTPPIMPKLDESKNIFYGSFTFSHALSLAQNALLERDFVRARIWIYRAWDMQSGSKDDSKKVWELYLQSYEEDAIASMQEKQKAKAIFKNAQEYYGF